MTLRRAGHSAWWVAAVVGWLASASCSLRHAPGGDVTTPIDRAPPSDVVAELAPDADTPDGDVLAMDAAPDDADAAPPFDVPDARPDVGPDVRPDVPPDRPVIPDVILVDTGPGFDTGPPVDTGTVMGPCGGNGEACCDYGECDNPTERVCIQRTGERMPLCRDCGGNGQPCCAFGNCLVPTRVCTRLAGELDPSCRDCGGNGQPCCAGGACGGAAGTRVCVMQAGEANPACRDCGGNGQPCCEAGRCDGTRRCVKMAPDPVPRCR